MGLHHPQNRLVVEEHLVYQARARHLIDESALEGRGLLLSLGDHLGEIAYGTMRPQDFLQTPLDAFQRDIAHNSEGDNRPI